MMMNSPFLCGRHDQAKKLLDASPEGAAKHFSMIRSCTTEADGSGGTCVFERSMAGRVGMNILMHSTRCWMRAWSAKPVMRCGVGAGSEG